MGRTVGIEDDENEEFHYAAIVTNADYRDGVFTVTFNGTLRDQLQIVSTVLSQIERFIFCLSGVEKKYRKKYRYV